MPSLDTELFKIKNKLSIRIMGDILETRYVRYNVKSQIFWDQFSHLWLRKFWNIVPNDL